jgi:hypothetical protein
MATETKLMSSVRCPRGHYVALGGRIPQASETVELTSRCKQPIVFRGDEVQQVLMSRDSEIADDWREENFEHLMS